MPTEIRDPRDFQDTLYIPPLQFSPMGGNGRVKRVVGIVGVGRLLPVRAYVLPRCEGLLVLVRLLALGFPLEDESERGEKSASRREISGELGISCRRAVTPAAYRLPMSERAQQR